MNAEPGVVPKHVNECRSPGCPVSGTHHHLILGGQQLSHPGTIEICESEPCTAIVSKFEADEAGAARDQDIANEAMKIAEWWVETSKHDAGKTVPKAIEYGSLDFDLMGVFMTGLLGDRLDGADDAEKKQVGQEMAVLFYLIGKLGRAIGAYNQGVLPSDDTLFDTSVYAMMWRRIRETGRWIS